MLPRERVIAVIEKRKPDRIPVYGWLHANVDGMIAAACGSVEAFEDRYEFDYAHVFGGPNPCSWEMIGKLQAQHGGTIEPGALLDAEWGDPNESAAYQSIRDALDHHKTKRGRFVYMQTPGIFEALNGPFGIENHLMYLCLYESELHEVYRRQAEWNRAFAMNCLDLGVDMIHVSDDWGAQRGLLFSPDTWWKLMYPYHKITCDAVLQRKGYLSLHSDGDVTSVLDGIVKLGYQVVHPFQESAGMDWAEKKRKYDGAFAIMGGLDIQTTLGFGDYEKLQREIERVLQFGAEGGLLLCTSHFVQSHCTMEELHFAYDLIHKLLRKPQGG
jgi:uroporphyrinogen decarboxylase